MKRPRCDCARTTIAGLLAARLRVRPPVPDAPRMLAGGQLEPASDSVEELRQIECEISALRDRVARLLAHVEEL